MEEEISISTIKNRKGLGDPKLSKELLEKLKPMDNGDSPLTPKNSPNKNRASQDRYSILQQNIFNTLVKWTDTDDKVEDTENEHKKIKLELKFKINDFEKSGHRNDPRSKSVMELPVVMDSNRVILDLESDSFEQLVVMVPTYDKEELDFYEEHASSSAVDSESSSSLDTELYIQLKKHIFGEIQNNEDRSEIKKLISFLIDED